MRFAVLAAPDSWYLRDLQRAAALFSAASPLDVTPLDFRRLVAELDGRSVRWRCGGEPLESFDAVLVRTMPPGTLEQVVTRMDFLGEYERAGGLVVNPSRAIETAVDKYLTNARLQAAGLAAPRTVVCQHSDDALEAFERLGGDVVVKPLFGSEGRGITRVSDPDLALRAFRMLEQMGAVLYLQEFIDHPGYDLRVLVIGERTWGMRRRNTSDWRTNVSRGATGERFDVPDDLREMALRAARAVGAWVAGVDFLPSRDGRLFAIEVNAVPGWKALARAHDLDVARAVLEFVVEKVRAR